MKPIVPGTTVRCAPGTAISAVALEARARFNAPSSPCGTAKLTWIGFVWLMVTSGRASVPRTMAPILAVRLPVRPVIGARIVR